MQRFTTLISIVFSFQSLLIAQQIELTGQVTDIVTSQPIAGCEIITERSAAITNDVGDYSISVAKNDLVTFQHIGYQNIALAASAVPAIVQMTPVMLQGEEVKVYGALRTQSVLESGASISVIRQHEIAQSSEPHFQTLINTIPNLNWAGGSSRPRYFQIRGIGERSQYAGDGPPNFSVGFSVDDLDLSGIGMSGLTFDVNRIELFRGPQSSIYGPNALAGFIVLRSEDPGESHDAYVKVSAGNANTYSLGAAFNLPEISKVQTRVAIYHGYNNGYRHNEYLDVDNTNQRKESMGRIKLIWSALPNLRFKATLLAVNLDNGYDAWSPDNAPFRTYTDNPGKDSQQLNAGVVKAIYDISPRTSLQSISSSSLARMENSYDSDWGNDAFWLEEPYNFDPAVEGWRYDFSDKLLRRRETRTQEIRFNHSSSNERIRMIAGLYYKDLLEQDDAEGYLFGGDESELQSEFQLRNQSVYAQLDYDISEKLLFTTNFRTGKRSTDYSDNKQTEFSMTDQLSGGKIALLFRINDRKSVFVNVARGFKAGGINQHPRILDINRPFSPEYVNNYEVGFRSVSNSSMFSITSFYTQRIDQQVSLSSQQDPMDPNSFTYYIGNASEGYSYGMELELSQNLTKTLQFSASLGLLESKTKDYSFEVAPTEWITLGDRAFAHAPSYSYHVSFEYLPTGKLSIQASISGKDKFYFSESHDQVSKPYSVVNLGMTYRWSPSLNFSLFADNLLDTRYATRGFYFGLEPPNYNEKLYLTYADPRHLGLSVKYRF